MSVHTIATAAAGRCAPPPSSPRAAPDRLPERVPSDHGPAPDKPPARSTVAALVHDAGMATAEYAIATLAACGFAGVLVALLGSGQVKALLLGIIRRALSVG